MDHDSGVITYPKFRMWLRSDGIVQLVWSQQTTVLIEDASAALEAMAQLTGGRLRPLLIDMRDTGPQDRSARAEWTRRTDLSSAVAMVVGTPVSWMMGNLFIRVNKPPFPARLFDNEACAVAWLQKFVG